jgi:hypothetical protein
VVTVCKAEPIHAGDEVQGRCIDITESMPTFSRDSYIGEARAFHLRQAELIHGALIASLPGGTLGNLFALMAAERATVHRVPFRTDAGPFANGAWIAYYADYSDVVVFGNDGELAALRHANGMSMEVIFVPAGTSVRDAANAMWLAAADAQRERLLATPAPAEGDVVDAEIDYTEAYTELAEMRLAVLAIHKPTENHGYGQDCQSCIGSAETPLRYPCPTAQALGVRS